MQLTAQESSTFVKAAYSNSRNHTVLSIEEVVVLNNRQGLFSKELSFFVKIHEINRSRDVDDNRFSSRFKVHDPSALKEPILRVDCRTLVSVVQEAIVIIITIVKAAASALMGFKIDSLTSIA